MRALVFSAEDRGAQEQVVVEHIPLGAEFEIAVLFRRLRFSLATLKFSPLLR